MAEVTPAPTAASTHVICDLGVAEPNLLIVTKRNGVHNGYPVRKEALADASTVFADMLSLSSAKTDPKTDEEEHWPPAYHNLARVNLEDNDSTLHNAFRYLFRTCELPELAAWENVEVYKLADKYGMQRLASWMQDKIVLDFPHMNIHLLLYLCETSSLTNDVRLQRSVAARLNAVKKDWHLLELGPHRYGLGAGASEGEGTYKISASCAAILMHACMLNSTAVNFY